jgi:uncharacterized damage-inducible protein DinB
MSMEEINSYIETLRALRAEALRFVDFNDAVAMNWTPPAAETNTLYQLLTHMAGSEAWWIQQVVGGTDVGRNRPAEFAASGDDMAALKARYEAVARRSEEVLRGLSATDLSAMRGSTSDQHSVRWCILHVIEHTTRHIGHIELTSQMYQALSSKPA